MSKFRDMVFKICEGKNGKDSFIEGTLSEFGSIIYDIKNEIQVTFDCIKASKNHEELQQCIRELAPDDPSL